MSEQAWGPTTGSFVLLVYFSSLNVLSLGITVAMQLYWS